jgi:hypothetical protein
MIFLSFIVACGFQSTESSLSEEQKNFLEEQKSILEKTLQKSKNVSSQIIAYKSPNLENWSLVTNVAMPHSFTSLGLHHENGHMVLTGQHHVQPPTKQEEDMSLTWSQLLHFDEKKWWVEIRHFSYPKITAHADHQWLNDRLWFYAPEPSKNPHTDPILFEGAHRILSTNPNKLQLSLPYIGDPSPVEFQKEIHLFLSSIQPSTMSSSIEYYRQKTPRSKYELQKRFLGYSNPFAFTNNQNIYLFMQKQNSISYTIADDHSWSDIKKLPNLNCENPVVGKGKQGWWLFCVKNNHSIKR